MSVLCLGMGSLVYLSVLVKLRVLKGIMHVKKCSIIDQYYRLYLQSECILCESACDLSRVIINYCCWPESHQVHLHVHQ